MSLYHLSGAYLLVMSLSCTLLSLDRPAQLSRPETSPVALAEKGPRTFAHLAKEPRMPIT